VARHRGSRGFVSNHEDDWFLMGAPSPFYSGFMVSWLDKGSPEAVPVIPAGLACALLWGVIGLGLIAATAGRCSRLVAEQRGMVAQTEAALQAEDDALRAAMISHAQALQAAANAATAAPIIAADPPPETVVPKTEAEPPTGEGPEPAV